MLEKIMTVFLISILFIPLFLIIDGYAISNLWNWFLAPLIHVYITKRQAIGLGLLSASLTHQWIPKPDELSEKQIWSLLWWLLGFPLMLLALGKIIISL